MKYVIGNNAYAKIYTFYLNVAEKYSNTYSTEDIHRDINNVKTSIYKIENGLLRKNPTIKRWEGKGFMANTKKWYFLYRIEGDTVFVEDACHALNMKDTIEEVVSKAIHNHITKRNFYVHESKDKHKIVSINKSCLYNIISEVITTLLWEYCKYVMCYFI